MPQDAGARLPVREILASGVFWLGPGSRFYKKKQTKFLNGQKINNKFQPKMFSR